ncbi:hypothetical protein IW261DRAFT_1570138 [Armillaria novae-zelandiae]|uniref:PRMT5 TIM barrel domain-containing protein n=1 Tax=Armillaria novae-zelandiae TaxID=153914 RepID=A0AA39TXU2_9AGAR|nr:hypothetical protein IW261DRAFT_1570138 [Armillaria novae-zelandiae]
MQAQDQSSFRALWEMWDTIWTLCGYYLRLSVSLDLMPPLPSIAEAYAVELSSYVMTSASSFISNDKDPVLPKTTFPRVEPVDRERREFEEYAVGYRHHGKPSTPQFLQEAMDVQAWQPGALFSATSFNSFRPKF